MTMMRKSVNPLLLPALLLLVLAAPAIAADKQDDGLMRLHILWTNDVHGHIAPEPARFMNPAFPPPLGGAPSAARYIKDVRRQAEEAGEPVLLVDVGDMWQGTPIGTMTKGTSVIDYFNSIGYDFAVPGNHEFDKGADNVERLARMSNFPWVCCNLLDEKTGEILDYLEPYMMLDIEGVKIGVVGILTPATKSMSFPENVAGLEFAPMPEKVSEYRDLLLAKGADLIFLAIHEGLPYDPDKGWKRIVEDNAAATAGEQQGTFGSNHSDHGMNLMELVHEVPGIDFAVGGHTHRGYHHPWIDPVNHTMCFETFGNGSSIGHVILLIDRQSKTLMGYEGAHDRGTLITLFEDEIWPDAETTAVIEPYMEETERAMSRVLGSSAIPLGRGGPGANLVGNMVTDAMIDYFDADFSFQNLGGLRADLPAGDLTSRDIFGVLPFGNELVVVEMDGRMVRRIIERKLAGRSGGLCIGGAEMSFDKTRADYDRVVKLEIAGEPWDPNRVYKVVCTSFLIEGNSGLDFLTGIKGPKVAPTGIITAEAVERYLQKHSPIRPQVDQRWVEATGTPQAPYLAAKYLH
ncbi:multifunctional 2',3'-cyclic-nucleotide 2'-phosphodiesterase/5'-nucleotidase/3'-nucleotidase [bacterium DOLJORAL78_65_58]|nr:MAG: multifunctional 2',3'-cyclic-nucleotide 2'-phosphodiesterase/5'-nucleotidase/3'-nucleotidase [bacterium DOLZORAL124_64_63]PIE76229.1 MAG: multifunctional 2',3'-cyclic-nucleotide 2'-phosphodiesterase/5'-nucleotidase/3'-nucleotidase [bacterium DOLJORAL78_65_58]